MLNIKKSKNIVLIANISFITFLNFAFYTRAASLRLASKGPRGFRLYFTRPRPRLHFYHCQLLANNSFVPLHYILFMST